MMVPGGLEALAFAAHAKSQIPPQRFFVEYSRTLVNATRLDTPLRKSPLAMR